MPTLDEWGVSGASGSDEPNVPVQMNALKDSIRGRFPAYFATKAARNAATATFLARPGNASATGMQAYVGELRANTVYLPTVGWRFVSALVEEGVVQRGYGTGAVANPGNTFPDSGGIDLTNQIVGSKLRVHSQFMLKVDGINDQTVLWWFGGSGFSRDTVDPGTTPRRILGSASPDKFAVYYDIQQFEVTNATVAMRLNMVAGGGVDRLVMMYALHHIFISQSSPSAAA